MAPNNPGSFILNIIFSMKLDVITLNKVPFALFSVIALGKFFSTCTLILCWFSLCNCHLFFRPLLSSPSHIRRGEISIALTVVHMEHRTTATYIFNFYKYLSHE